MVKSIEEMSLEEAGETLAKFRKLVQSPEWGLLAEVAKVQIHRRRRDATSGPKVDEAAQVLRDWNLAEAAGIEVCLGLPQVLIDTVSAHISDKEKTNAGSQ